MPSFSVPVPVPARISRALKCSCGIEPLREATLVSNRTVYTGGKLYFVHLQFIFFFLKFWEFITHKRCNLRVFYPVFYATFSFPPLIFFSLNLFSFFPKLPSPSPHHHRSILHNRYPCSCKEWILHIIITTLYRIDGE